jgi:hypothetical protein
MQDLATQLLLNFAKGIEKIERGIDQIKNYQINFDEKTEGLISTLSDFPVVLDQIIVEENPILKEKIASDFVQKLKNL